MTANKSKPVIAVAAVAEDREWERHVALKFGGSLFKKLKAK